MLETQAGMLVEFTGVTGAGKSTVAEKVLHSVVHTLGAANVAVSSNLGGADMPELAACRTEPTALKRLTLVTTHPVFYARYRLSPRGALFMNPLLLWRKQWFLARALDNGLARKAVRSELQLAVFDRGLFDAMLRARMAPELVQIVPRTLLPDLVFEINAPPIERFNRKVQRACSGHTFTGDDRIQMARRCSRSLTGAEQQQARQAVEQWSREYSVPPLSDTEITSVLESLGFGLNPETQQDNGTAAELCAAATRKGVTWKTYQNSTPEDADRIAEDISREILSRVASRATP